MAAVTTRSHHPLKIPFDSVKVVQQARQTGAPDFSISRRILSLLYGDSGQRSGEPVRMHRGGVSEAYAPL